MVLAIVTYDKNIFMDVRKVRFRLHGKWRILRYMAGRNKESAATLISGFRIGPHQSSGCHIKIWSVGDFPS
jgi:hypothetical protein